MRTIIEGEARMRTHYGRWHENRMGIMEKRKKGTEGTEMKRTRIRDGVNHFETPATAVLDAVLSTPENAIFLSGIYSFWLFSLFFKWKNNSTWGDK